MHAEVGTAQANTPPTCLAEFRLLSAVTKSAIEALTSNNLQQFETAVVAQAAVCDKIEHLRSAGSTDGEQVRPTPELRSALVELDSLNRVYGSLVRRSRRFVELLLTVHRGSGYNGTGSTMQELHKWSSEA